MHNQKSHHQCIGSCILVADADDSSRVVCLNCKRESSLLVTDADNSKTAVHLNHKEEYSLNRVKISDFLSIAVASVLLSFFLNGCATYEKNINTNTSANIMILSEPSQKVLH